MSRFRIALAGTLLGLAATLASGCGAPETLSDPIVCATPTAVPPATNLGNRAAESRYINATNVQIGRLENLGAQFIQRWPNRKFSRTSDFREDLAKTSDAAACLAQQIQAVPAPERYREYDSSLDTVLAAFATDAAKGREAARQRNTSTFREWLEAIDRLPGEIDVVQATVPPRQ